MSDDHSSAAARAQGYVDDARTKGVPSPSPIGAAPREAGRILLLFCPEQGGWHTGEWWDGRWVSSANIEVVLEPTHWSDVPQPPEVY